MNIYVRFYLPKVKVLKTYRQLNSIVLKNYEDEDQQIVGCPSQEQVSSSHFCCSCTIYTVSEIKRTVLSYPYSMYGDCTCACSQLLWDSFYSEHSYFHSTRLKGNTFIKKGQITVTVIGT